jgi:hypothetical protein
LSERENKVVDVGEKERRDSGTEGEREREEGSGERMCDCERGDKKEREWGWTRSVRGRERETKRGGRERVRGREGEIVERGRCKRENMER